MAIALAVALLSALWVSGVWADRDRSTPKKVELVVLMETLAKSGIVRADFVETRRISLLRDEIRSEGKLYFAPSDRLARHTTHPGVSRVVVHGSRVWFRDATGERTLDLASNDVARGLLENLMVLLRGDLDALQERYVLAFRSEGSRWSLDLYPRAKALKAVVESIRVSGIGATLASMETLETNGDRTHLAFSKVETGLVLAPGEQRRIFSTAP